MVGWVMFILLGLVMLTVLTLAWWRLGDLWADGEHKRFGPKNTKCSPGDPANQDNNAPTVIKTRSR